MSQIDRYFERYGPAYKWLATGTIMVATISVVLSTTIVNVAIPAVMGAFGMSAVQAQWISTGFLAAMTATMLLADWTNRAFGTRLTMNAAMSVFLAGSVLGGLAPNETILTLARVVQGAAAGIVQPLAMIMLFKVFPPDKRGAAMGIYGVGVVPGSGSGTLDWRLAHGRFRLALRLLPGPALRRPRHSDVKPVPAQPRRKRTDSGLRLCRSGDPVGLSGHTAQHAVERAAAWMGVQHHPGGFHDFRCFGHRLRRLGDEYCQADARYAAFCEFRLLLGLGRGPSSWGRGCSALPICFRSSCSRSRG